jgi:shikimate kinase
MACERIYIVGFMGSGKTTIGRELALKLRWRFIDLDAEIEAAEKLTVREIFSRFGEARFRELERQQLLRLSMVSDAVIALGGGAYIDARNREVVENTGVSVWLQTSLAAIRERIRPDGVRPLFADPGKVEALYAERRSAYQHARIQVMTDNRLPEEIAEEIVREVARL